MRSIVRYAAAQSRYPESYPNNAATWAPALQRTVEVTLRWVRGTRARFVAPAMCVEDDVDLRGSMSAFPEADILKLS